jgi:hypothetical protein
LTRLRILYWWGQECPHENAGFNQSFNRCNGYYDAILANAAMHYLCDGINWARSMETFMSGFLDRGAVDKRRKGELFSRFIFTLAHDSIVGPLGHHDATNQSAFNAVMPTFSADSFLKALFSDRPWPTSMIRVKRVRKLVRIPANKLDAREVIRLIAVYACQRGRPNFAMCLAVANVVIRSSPGVNRRPFLMSGMSTVNSVKEGSLFSLKSPRQYSWPEP